MSFFDHAYTTVFWPYVMCTKSEGSSETAWMHKCVGHLVCRKTILNWFKSRGRISRKMIVFSTTLDLPNHRHPLWSQSCNCKKGSDWVKRWVQSSALYLSCKVFHDWSIISKRGKKSIWPVYIHCFCWFSLQMWFRKKEIAFWYLSR